MTKLEEAFIKVHWFEKYFQRKSAVKKQLFFLKKLRFAHFFQPLKIERRLHFQHNVEFVFSTC